MAYTRGTEQKLQATVSTITHHEIEVALPTIANLDSTDSVSVVFALPTREGRPASQTIRLNARLVMAMADQARGGW